MRAQFSMESKAIRALLPAATFPGVSADDHALGMVQLLWAFSDCLAVIWVRRPSHMGAVPLSRNGAASYLISHVVAPGSRLSAVGVCCCHCLGRSRRSHCVVMRAKIISAAGHADGVVLLPEPSIFPIGSFFASCSLRGA